MQEKQLFFSHGDKRKDKMRNIRISIKDIVILSEENDKTLLYGQFLDDFYHEKDKENKYNLIKDEPAYMPGEDVFMCMLAGAAHKLAKDYGLKIPEWVMKSKYILKNKYYAFDTKNKEFQEYLEKTTPEEYRMRNLIVGDTVLERC